MVVRIKSANCASTFWRTCRKKSSQPPYLEKAQVFAFDGNQIPKNCLDHDEDWRITFPKELFGDMDGDMDGDGTPNDKDGQVECTKPGACPTGEIYNDWCSYAAVSAMQETTFPCNSLSPANWASRQLPTTPFIVTDSDQEYAFITNVT